MLMLLMLLLLLLMLLLLMVCRRVRIPPSSTLYLVQNHHPPASIGRISRRAPTRHVVDGASCGRHFIRITQSTAVTPSPLFGAVDDRSWEVCYV